MSMRTLAHRRRGFTLIELLIVVVVIGILALIIVPRLMGAARKAKEAALKSDLQQLRNAIAQFEGDTGYYPATLSELVQTDGLDGSYGTETANVNAAYQGPYLTPSGGITGMAGIPHNPFVAAATKNNVNDNWHYDAATGVINSAVAGTTADGAAFADL